MAEQDYTHQPEEQESSGLLLSSEPLGERKPLKFQAGGGDTDTTDAGDGTDGDGTDGTDGDSASDSDGSDGGDSDGTDILGGDSDATDGSDSDGSDS